MVFNVNKQWVLHNLHPESILNKFDHCILNLTHKNLICSNSKGGPLGNGTLIFFKLSGLIKHEKPQQKLKLSQDVTVEFQC